MNLNELFDLIKKQFPEFRITKSTYYTNDEEYYILDITKEIPFAEGTYLLTSAQITIEPFEDNVKYYERIHYLPMQDYFYVLGIYSGRRPLKINPRQCEQLLEHIEECYKDTMNLHAAIDSHDYVKDANTLKELGFKHIGLVDMNYQLDDGWKSGLEIGASLLNVDLFHKLTFYSFYVYDRKARKQIKSSTYESLEDLVKDVMD